MRAISQDVFGGPEVLRVVEQARPEAGFAQVLVRVRATSVNPTDFWHRASGGMLGRIVPLGWDVSGVVEAVGPGVTLFAPGDAVFGMPRQPEPAGTYAEFVVSPARHLARKPRALSHEEAAALPLVSLTAWQALVDVARVRPGQRVLVHAAGGGVGHVAVQIAKALGAEVVATASAAKHEFVRSLGADRVVDYRAEDFAQVVSDVDVVVDPVGGEYGPRSLRTLRPGGLVVSLASPAEAALGPVAAAQGRRAVFMVVEADRAGMLAVADLVERGLLRPRVDAVLPLEEVVKAHELGERGSTTGKIVLTAGEVMR
ncbi:NADP-dependent oxidoreductase [Dactylosporangium sp. NPDC051541]|uniref:NADP-dependent oxidoreductase n=1 Tax=Dactylosporangium sp. NPDC051541 TaxID=3363977 RepID=UPI00379B7F0F